MLAPILATKLFIPPPPAKVVLRPRLLERLNESLSRKLTLISAPAGFGKTTLVSEWLAGCKRQAVWLSLDQNDNDPTRFLSYLISALQTISHKLGAEILAALQSPQPPPTESILSALLNALARGSWPGYGKSREMRTRRSTCSTKQSGCMQAISLLTSALSRR